MGQGRSRSPHVDLGALIDGASPDALRNLLGQLVAEQPDIVPTCLDVLGGTLPAGTPARTSAAAAAAQALWSRADDILAEFNAYGGGSNGDEEELRDILDQLAARAPELPRRARRELLDECLEYIASGNTGLDDPLYDLAYAFSPDDKDLRHLAECFEQLGKDWPADHARRIYRGLDDEGNYLRLRLGRLRYGLDYYDLATFYFEHGERQKALETAREGLAKGEGRMDELRMFVAEDLVRSGDRRGALELGFANLLEGLSPKSYRSFREQCSESEWKDFEPRLLAALARLAPADRIGLHMEREEYAEAVRLLPQVRFDHWRISTALQAATVLEQMFPREVIDFYRGGLGRMDRSASRNEYARWAELAAKMRHVWVDVMRNPHEWRAFARQLKVVSERRPAMREEFGRVLPDWDAL